MIENHTWECPFCRLPKRMLVRIVTEREGDRIVGTREDDMPVISGAHYNPDVQIVHIYCPKCGVLFHPDSI
jgi:hypothetical protein